MGTINTKYRQFHQALILSPEYVGIADKNRRACKEFVDLASKLDMKSPPAAVDVETAYQAALDEARSLVAAGVLSVQLPDDEPRSAPKTDTEANDTPTSPLKYDIHPTAAIFPMMSEEALKELAADIKEYGLREPIVLHNSEVIDGRNRLEACHRAGVEPTFTEWTGSGSVVTWILSVNLHRRHLTDQQRAMIAAKVAQELATEAKMRSSENLRRNRDLVEGLDPTPRSEGKSTERAAKLLNVSNDATKKAAKIAKSGTDELVRAVTEGKISLDAASQVAALPKEKQRKLVETGKVKQAAKNIREEKAAPKVKDKSGPAPGPNHDEHEPRSNSLPPSSDSEQVTDCRQSGVPIQEADGKAAEEADKGPHRDDEDGGSDGVPLLWEVHCAIDEMVQAGHSARQADKVTAVLKKLIEFCGGCKAKFENAAIL